MRQNTKSFVFFFICTFIFFSHSFSQFTHQDTLRGSIGPGRAWWNVTQYNIDVTVNIDKQTISGSNKIYFEVTRPGQPKTMQLDLQEPMEIEKVEFGDANENFTFTREGNVYWISFGEKKFSPQANKKTSEYITVYFKGKPRAAKNAPWDGGWVWDKDEKKRPWITVACQGLGASVWYPCKDHQSDEPDNGATLSITIPDTLTAVGNGRLVNKISNNNGTATWQWKVVNPINNYNIIPYIGKYVSWEENFEGEKGLLNCSYWVLDYNLEKAKAHFANDVKPMLSCFENWFGPYPFYEDGFKLVESPHLGMEHQSAVAYGNRYQNGYRGRDLSGTGWGNKWDFIIVHECGHEWFANNITTNDIADMWVHEGFTNYSETIYTQCRFGTEAGNEYCQGIRRNIVNKSPIIGTYGVNAEGSGDMYPKGANMIHTIRQIINDDEKFKAILRGLNKDFFHSTTTSLQVEKCISREAGKDFSKVFDQYLRTIKIPVLEYSIKGNKISYNWADCVSGFNMPVKVKIEGKEVWLRPGVNKKIYTVQNVKTVKSFVPDANFYIKVRKV